MPGGNGRGPATGSGRGRRMGMPKNCVCPSCGYTEEKIRGMPCAQKTCPKCGMKLTGEF